MNKKELFIRVVDLALSSMEVHPVAEGNVTEEEFKEAMAYFDALKAEKTVEKPRFTDNGKLILKYMQDEHEKYNNMFKAREIAEGIFIQSRSVSGSIRKLVTDGYVEKIGADPVVYALTEEGKTTTVE